MCTSCMYEVRLKVSSFQKVTLFLQYKIFNRDDINLRFRMLEDVTDDSDLRKINYKSLFR